MEKEKKGVKKWLLALNRRWVWCTHHPITEGTLGPFKCHYERCWDISNIAIKAVFSDRTTLHTLHKRHRGCCTCTTVRRSSTPNPSWGCGMLSIWHGKYGETRSSLSLSYKMDRESPPSVLVTRNFNWSLEIGYGDWLRKGKVLAPQLRPT